MTKEYGTYPSGPSYYTCRNKIMKMMIFIHGVFALFPRPAIAFIREKNKEKSGLIGAEIGVFGGENAKNILKVLPIRRLYLIDPYKSYREFDRKELSIAEAKAMKRVNKHKDKVIFIKKTSVDAVNDIPGDLDFVYIDGDHSYESTLADMENYYSKLKVGGVLSGHDIENIIHPKRGVEIVNQVAKALVEFAYKKNLDPYIRHPDWWVVKEK